ncbi:protein NRT1/ PTR FAMILY 5.2-like [Phalaenopsis equestris]|uniref:protein NRT1/ PTR FAMILY 5.2-like n=1 Tax=Phalaenopsis equestris TaxID=78828 RepID=UPI0009E441B0|nr:protein NRT1/ PTR FAMILY 5.2-like [Phalaenopsis equestris]
MADEEKGNDEHREDEYTKDGTVDLRGRPFLRAKGGGWAASSCILASDALERMSFFGVAPNLIFYLTNVLHQDTVTSANNVTNWLGTIMMTSVLTAFIADSYLGRYRTYIICSFIYLPGMIFLTLTVSLPALRPPACDLSSQENCKGNSQISIFYYALYIMAFGVAGLKANSAALGAEQFDKFDPKEQAQKISFFNWWTFAISLGNLLATTLLIYVENDVSWSLGYTMATIFLAISLLVFVLGTPLYRHKLPSGSPFTRIAQVVVAAIRKSSVALPDQDSTNDRHVLSTSLTLKFFDKAAVKTNSSNSDSPWMSCPVCQVEETKQIIRIFPMFMATIMPSVMMAQVFTIFVKQGTALDPRMGSHFKLHPANLSAVYMFSTLVGVVVYDRFLLPLARKRTNNPRGITFLQRIGIGLVMHIFIMLGAALVERWRLSRKSSTSPSTMFVLLPQFALMGIAEVFAAVGKMEFFYDQSPEGMKSMGASFFYLSNGIGSFVSSFLLSTVSKVTEKDGGKGWVQNNLNSSHLDYYYALLAGLSAVNLLIFLAVSKFYVYKCVTVSSESDREKEGSK